MPSLADMIEAHLKKMFSERGRQHIEVQRAELARIFDCVPSQITYVLRTRFTPQKGYHIDSIRGGGGYIRIVQYVVDPQTVESIEGRVTEKEAHSIINELYQRGLLDRKSQMLIKIATSDRYLGLSGNADTIRSNLLKAMCSFAVSTQ